MFFLTKDERVKELYAYIYYYEPFIISLMMRPLFISILLVSTMISCKKDYTCTCVQTNVTTSYSEYGNYYPQTITSNTESNSLNSKKNDAASKCKKYDRINVETHGDGNSQRTVTETVTCEIK